MRFIKYTDEMIQFLRDVIPGRPWDDVAQAFHDRFGIRLTKSMVKNIRSRFGIKTDEYVKKPSVRVKFTPDMIEFLLETIPGHTQDEISALFEERFGWGLNKRQVKNLKARLRVKSGTAGGQFQKGTTSHNKGMRIDEFMSPDGIERSSATRFAPGHLPQNTKELLTERVSSDGYIYVKIAPGRSRKANDCWVGKHVLEWERVNGPLPEGMIVRFGDGDRSNFDPDNLVALTRSQNSRVNLMAKRGIVPHDAAELRAMVAVTEVRAAVTDGRKGVKKYVRKRKGEGDAQQ